MISKVQNPKTVLKGITWDHPRGFDPLQASSDIYLHNENVSVEWERRSLQAFADQSIADLAETFDLIVLDHPHIGQVAENGAVLELPMPELEEATIGHSAESYLWNGRCYAYAIDAACQMSVHRHDANISFPKYWYEFLKDDAARFKAITPLKPVDAFDMWLTMCAGFGQEEMPMHSYLFMTESPGLLGLDILKSLYKLGPSSAIDYNPIHVLEILSDQDQTDFDYSPCLFGYVNYASPRKNKRRLQYRNLPIFKHTNKRRSILGGAGIAVSSHCASASEAIAYCKWIASPEIQAGLYVENNGQPASNSCWDAMRNDSDLGGFFGGAYETMSQAWTRPREPWFLDFVDDVCEIFPAFFTQDRSEVDFLSNINSLYRHHAPQEKHSA